MLFSRHVHTTFREFYGNEVLMEQDLKTFLEEVNATLSTLDYVHPETIPDIELYMDQVLSFLDDKLQASKRNEEDKILTRTMINNYSKSGLLPSPVKKKYSRDHMLLLIFIYYFKNIMSISDIRTVLGPVTEKYFNSEDGLDLKDIYAEVFSLEKGEILSMMKDLGRKYKVSSQTFADVPEEDRDELQKFTLLCMLSFDVYIKKIIIEQIVDNM